MALSVIQFGFQLFEGIPNARLVSLSNQIIVYITQIFDYITYQTDQKPYPYSSLPTKAEKKTKAKSKKDQDLIQVLMGDDVAPRKDFIINRALEVSNLDI